MPRTTNIEQLMDLSEIFEKKGPQQQQQRPPQSLDGYPRPPHMNSSFDDQMSSENDERERQRNSFQGKIRQSSDMRKAVNAGSSMSDPYPMIMSSQYNQRGDIVPYYDDNEDNDFENDYELGPKIKKQQPSFQQPSYMDFHTNTPSNLSCMDIARHVKSCPICSKLYENDKSIYIIGIVFLLVVCIILLKKVIENTK